MNRIINQVVNLVNTDQVKEDSFIHTFSGEKITINNNSFRTIEKNNEQSNNQITQKEEQTKRITFIDGGSSIIFGSSNYCVANIKLAYVTYSGKELVGREVFSLLSYFDLFNKSVQCFPLEGDSTFVNNLTNSIVSVQGESVEEMVNNLRRLCELSLGKEVMNKCDMVVFDGSLECKSKEESEIITQINNNSNNKPLVGFCKSCSLLTQTGRNVIDVVSTLEKTKSEGFDIWYLETNEANNNINNNSKITFAKLNPKSKNIFRVDFIGTNPLSSLLEQCTDAVFLGYPYGLVRVDMEARVSDHEKSILRTMFNSKIDLDTLEQSNNAHSRLDKISY